MFFVFCVGVAVFTAPQDGLRRRLLFVFAVFLCVCFGVRSGIFFTCGTWLHVEVAAVWMWRYMPNRLLFTNSTQKRSTEPLKESRQALF